MKGKDPAAPGKRARSGKRAANAKPTASHETAGPPAGESEFQTPPESREGPPSAHGQESDCLAAGIGTADQEVVNRVEHLNRGAGWALITAGVVGLVVPGVLGTPFLIMGALALWPGNRKKMERWRQGHSPKAFHGAMKQINRFLDDLEKRYPRKER